MNYFAQFSVTNWPDLIADLACSGPESRFRKIKSILVFYLWSHLYMSARRGPWRENIKLENDGKKIGAIDCRY